MINDADIKDTSFIVGFTNVFTDRNGEIEGYSVIVTTDRFKPKADMFKMDSWASVRSSKPTQPYQAIPVCPDFFNGDNAKCNEGDDVHRHKRATQVQFTIGGDSSCDENNKDQYCNGPVKPEETYYVKLRAYTQDGLFADTAYSQPILTSMHAHSYIFPVFIECWV